MLPERKVQSHFDAHFSSVLDVTCEILMDLQDYPLKARSYNCSQLFGENT